jgi:hypothetical protein
LLLYCSVNMARKQQVLAPWEGNIVR